MGYDLFISYSSRQKTVARALKAALDALTEPKIESFLDETDLADDRPVTKELSLQLRASKALVALWSPSYASSRPCQWELTAALIAATPDQEAQQILVATPDGGRDGHGLPRRLTEQPLLDWSQPADALAAQIQRRLKPAATKAFSDRYGVAPRHDLGPERYANESFVGRLREMWEIDAALFLTAQGGVDSDMPYLCRLQGLGGMGKSALATEYAQRFSRRFPGGIFRLPMSGDASASAIANTLGRLLEEAGKNLKDLPAEAGVYRHHIGQMLTTGQAYLWLVDDLPNGLSLEAFRLLSPPTKEGRVLVTCRGPTLEDRGRQVDLDVLLLDEACDLLRRGAPHASDGVLRQIAERLGRLALAVAIAAHAIKTRGPERLLQFLQQDGLKALDGPASKLSGLSDTHRQGVIQTFRYAVQGLAPESLALLRCLARLAPAFIPLALIYGVLGDSCATADALDALTAAGLVAQRPGDAVALHALLAEVVRLDDAVTDPAALQRQLWDTVAPHLTALQEHPAARGSSADWLTQARFLAETALRDHQDDAPLALLAACYDKLGDLTDAAEAWRQVAAARGPNHPQHLATQLHYAAALRAQGDFKTALVLQQAVYDARIAALGPDHLDSLTAAYELGWTLCDLGRLTEAYDLTRRAVEGDFAQRNPDDLNTLKLRHNLAVLANALGSYDEARCLEEQVLERRMALLGDDHSDTLTTMGSLAGTLWDQGDLSGARKLLEQVLERRTALLGEDHPLTLTTRGNLASTLKAQGDLPGARKRYEQVLAKLTALLGADHPDTLATMGNLASTLKALGDLPGARALEEQVLAKRTALLDADHPDTLTAMANLGGTLNAQGQTKAALTLIQTVHQAHQRTLGPDHPNTLSAAANLAKAYANNGNRKAAKLLALQTWPRAQKILHAKHGALALLKQCMR